MTRAPVREEIRQECAFPTARDTLNDDAGLLRDERFFKRALAALCAQIEPPPWGGVGLVDTIRIRP